MTQINAKTHPIALKKLQDYLLSQVGSSPELAEHAQLIATASAQMALNTGGGVVIEWLDGQKLHIITVIEGDHWYYDILDGKKFTKDILVPKCTAYKTRKEAEKAGIEAAMDILEKQ